MNKIQYISSWSTGMAELASFPAAVWPGYEVRAELHTQLPFDTEHAVGLASTNYEPVSFYSLVPKLDYTVHVSYSRFLTRSRGPSRKKSRTPSAEIQIEIQKSRNPS